MSRSWKRTVPLPARGPLQMPGVQKPNVVEAHAMELIKSMLYLADTTGHSAPRHPPCCHHHLSTMLCFLCNMLHRSASVVDAWGMPGLMLILNLMGPLILLLQLGTILCPLEHEGLTVLASQAQVQCTLCRACCCEHRTSLTEEDLVVNGNLEVCCCRACRA